MDGAVGGGAGTASGTTGASAQSSAGTDAASTTGGSAGAAQTAAPSSAQTQSSGTGAPKPAAKPPSEAEWRYRDRLKARNGTERDVEYTRDELRRKIQLADAQEDGFKALRAEREKFAREQARLKSENPAERLEALRALGFEPDDFARSRLAELAKLELMTAEERRAHEAEEKTRAAEAKAAKYEKDVSERTAREAEARMWQQMEPVFNKELSAKDIPMEPWAMKLLADVASDFTDAQVDADPQMMVAEMDRRLDGIFTQRLSKMSIETLEKRLGPERLKQLFARRAGAVKKESFEKMQNAGNGEPAPATKKREYIDPDQFSSWLRQQRR